MTTDRGGGMVDSEVAQAPMKTKRAINPIGTRLSPQFEWTGGPTDESAPER